MSEMLEDDVELLETHLIRRQRVPLILQSEAMECGLASLAMAMAAYGLRYDLASLRRKYPTSVMGTSFGALEDVAAQEGFVLSTYEASATDLAEAEVPAILYWHKNHFVVLTKYVKGKYVKIHDPAVGERKVAWESFVAAYSGYCACLEPKVSFKPAVIEAKISVWQLLKGVRNFWSTLGKVGVLALSLQALALLSPLFLQLVVDEIVPGRDVALLIGLAVGFAGVALIQGVFQMAQGWMGMALSGATTLAIKKNTLRYAMSLPLSWFEKRGPGVMSARFSSVDAIQQTLTGQLLSTALEAITSIVLFVALIVLNPALGLLAVLLSSISIAITVGMYKPYAVAAKEGLHIQAEEGRLLMEAVQAIGPLKMYGQEARHLKNYTRVVIGAINSQLTQQRVKTWQSVLTGAWTAISDIAMIAAGAFAVINGSISLGAVFGFYAYQQILSRNLLSLSNSYFSFKMLGVHAVNVGDILLADEEPSQGPALVTKPKPTLELRGVSYRYELAAKDALQPFSVTVNPGQVVGITGPSGSGKTTLVKVLTGALPFQAGDILIDGQSIRTTSPKQVRKVLSVVLQHDQLLTGTLRDNITMFDSPVDEERLAQAVRDAALEEVIADLPAGLDSQLQGHAPFLSGGQRQRLMLARAFYKDAPILVLDEATSALDTATEIRVSDAVRRRGTTTLVVAHRKETLARCDTVIHLQPCP